ncbi:response regulator [Halalkalibacter alkalisediminis]|uniref:histidine kinase n=1 Tax=Halalkalibacter alkalisediminis TaxID=935616 RepID=A0ABV6NHX4_9BACI|nr:response regulator [Halalkalibacter alkalisediminis]
MKFRTKLYTSLGSILIIIAIIVVVLLNLLEQSTVNMHVLVQELNERIDMSADIKYETANIGRQLKETTTDSTGTINKSVLNAWEESHVNLKLATESLEKKDTQEKSQELIAKFKTLHQSYQDLAQQIITIQRLEPDIEIQAALWEEAELTRQRMLQITELLHGLQEQELKNELFRSRDAYNWAVKVIYIYLAVGLVLCISLTIWVIKSITKNLNHVTAVMQSVKNDDVATLPRIKIASKDEFGAIARAFNKMAYTLEEQSKIENELKVEAEEQSWLKTRIAEIATMFPEIKNVQMLTEMVIRKLVPMVGGSWGIFYIKEVEGDKEYYKRSATYAIAKEGKGFEQTFQIGQGLIGQCAIEKRPILLDEIPDGFMKIQTGIGIATPKASIILPVEYEGNVLGVIEIASFGSFSKSQVKLLKEVISNIGVTMVSIANHVKAEKLLQESQVLTEELQAQSEELQVQQEELRTTNEKLEEQYETSEQKKKELEKVREALEEKAQQLELSSQYKSEFLANMSHELRTPLNSLLILAKILSENSNKNLTPKQEEYVRTIYSSGHDLLHLINDILDLAKVESGKLEVVPKEVKTKSIQQFVYRQFSPVARQKNVGLSIQVESNVPEQIFTDEHRLQQILKNLMSNAFKFTEHGSVTLLIQEKQMPDADPKQKLLVFSVSDTGIGIAKEKQNTIFDAFRQADGTTSRQYGGTGLGLSISREIASLLGGSIEIESEEGKGSTFILSIPYLQLDEKVDNTSVNDQEVAAGLEVDLFSESEIEEQDILNEEEVSMIQQKLSLLKDKKILIVDDDTRNVFALTSALEKYEMDIIYAENGIEGIEELVENPDTDLILMDIMMPKMDGFEAIRRIRKLPDFKTLPIIAVTAKAMKHNRDECLEAGATDYISKPIDMDQLLSLIQVWLYRK